MGCFLSICLCFGSRFQVLCKTPIPYHPVINFAEEGEDPILLEYDNIFIPVSDSSCLRLTMCTYSTAKGDAGISESDKDVITIMESLKVN